MDERSRGAISNGGYPGVRLSEEALQGVARKVLQLLDAGARDAVLQQCYEALSPGRVIVLTAFTDRDPSSAQERGGTGVRSYFASGELVLAYFFDPAAFVGQKFDAVVVSLVLEHVRELMRFFERAGSMLRSPGELLISELHPARAAAGTSANFLDPVSDERDDELKGGAKSRTVFGNSNLVRLDRPEVKLWLTDVLGRLGIEATTVLD